MVTLSGLINVAEANEFIDFLKALPEYLKYIYPGYITMYLYYFFRGYSFEDNKRVVIKSLVISCILNEINNLLFALADKLNQTMANNIKGVIFENGSLIILSVLIAFLAYEFTRCIWIGILFKKIDIETSLCTNEFAHLEKKNAYCPLLMIVYLKNQNIAYEGILSSYEIENSGNRYIILERYSKYKVDSNNGRLNYNTEDNREKEEKKVILYFDEILHIEVYQVYVEKKTNMNNIANYIEENKQLPKEIDGIEADELVELIKEMKAKNIIQYKEDPLNQKAEVISVNSKKLKRMF